MGVFSRISTMATAATVALAVAAPSTANAWEWPWAGWFTDEMAVDQPAGAVDDTPVTFGTGWYLRGDLSVAGETQIPVGVVMLPASNKFPNNRSLGLGVGYKYNNWLRSDVTVDYRSGREFKGNTTMGVVRCQDGAVGTPLGPGPYTGSAPVYGSCLDFVQARMNNVHMLFNVYADLGTWYGLTPYVGAGIGFNINYQRYQRNWYYNNGWAYSPTTWTDPFTLGSYTAYWDSKQAFSNAQLAWALMGGAAYNVTRHLALDVGLRFAHLGTIYTNNGYTATKQQFTAKEMRVGFRYTPD